VPPWPEARFAPSATVTDGHHLRTAEVAGWPAQRARANPFEVEQTVPRRATVTTSHAKERR
jgi:hypothetical protein